MQGVFEDGSSVLRGHGPHKDAEEEDFESAFGDVGPSYSFCAWVDGLVDEGWGPPEVAEVVECDVFRIWAG